MTQKEAGTNQMTELSISEMSNLAKLKAAAEAELAELKQATRAPVDVHVGMVVLFCIDEKGPELRPLLVTAVAQDHRTVDGTLFYRGDDDMYAAWVQRHSKTLPAYNQPAIWVKVVSYGLGLGQWRYQEDPR